MANESIKKAFQRFWEHTLNKIDDKADRTDLETLSSKVDEVEITANIQSDWNQNDETTVDYVKNRTHYTEMAETSTNILEWDGNGEGLVAAVEDANGGIYKISDAVLEPSDVINAVFTIHTIENGVENEIENIATDKNMSTISENLFTLNEMMICFVKEDNTKFEGAGINFPKAGIYFININTNGMKAHVTKLELTSGATPFITTSEVVHKLDAKYLPDMAGADEALEDIAELGLLEVMHHDGVIYQDATGKILSY